MGVPRTVQSGSFFPAVQDGEDIVEFPFAAHGDFLTFTLARTMAISIGRYTAPLVGSLINTDFGEAYLVNRQAPVMDKSGRFYRYTDTYAAIPRSRLEPIEFAHTSKVYGFALTSGVTSLKKCYLLYDYSLNSPLNPIEAVDFNTATFLAGGNISIFSGDWQTVYNDTGLGSTAFNYNQIVTSIRRQLSALKDSEISLWKGSIWQRVTLIGRYQLFGQESTPGAPTS